MSNNNFVSFNGKKINPIIFAIIAIGVLFIVFNLARIVFNILYFIAPILIIATLIINRKIVINYGKWIINLFKQNPLYGIGAGLFTFFAYPVIALFLFGRAMLERQIAQQFGEDATRTQSTTKQPTKGEYIDFEEIEQPLDLDDIPKRIEVKKNRNNDNEYDQLFD